MECAKRRLNDSPDRGCCKGYTGYAKMQIRASAFKGTHAQFGGALFAERCQIVVAAIAIGGSVIQ
jgi:hypothetical protein